MLSASADGREAGYLMPLLARRRSQREFFLRPVTQEALARILISGQGITSADGKRAAPSAGSIYPLQLMVIARQVEGVATGVYRFVPPDIALVHHRTGDCLLEDAMHEEQPWVDRAAAVIVVACDLSSVLREFADQQPDGQRGIRYADFEAGAAVQNMHLCAVEEKLGGVPVMGFKDEETAAALALPDGLTPIALFCVGSG